MKYCIGCWDCWWKTPGKCILKDDAERIFKSVINSDLFILASPLIAGFTSALMKRLTDRFIVLIHPYIKLINKESHHKKRYDNYPDMGLLIKNEDFTHSDDLKIICDIYDRMMLNFHCKRKFTESIDNVSVKDLINETNGISKKFDSNRLS